MRIGPWGWWVYWMLGLIAVDLGIVRLFSHQIYQSPNWISHFLGLRGSDLVRGLVSEVPTMEEPLGYSVESWIRETRQGP